MKGFTYHDQPNTHPYHNHNINTSINFHQHTAPSKCSLWAPGHQDKAAYPHHLNMIGSRYFATSYTDKPLSSLPNYILLFYRTSTTDFSVVSVSEMCYQRIMASPQHSSTASKVFPTPAKPSKKRPPPSVSSSTPATNVPTQVIHQNDAPILWVSKGALAEVSKE